jgi:ribosomal-protein-alanine N-acetyltransferase
VLKLNFIPFQEIKTERLLLRKLIPEDASVIFNLRSDPAVNKYVNRPLALDMNDALNFINNINMSIDRNNALYWGIYLVEMSQLIGTICVWNISANDAAAETGYELLPEFQGKGYVSEALTYVLDYSFHVIGLTSMYAYVLPSNARSIKVLNKLGFKLIGKAEEGDEVIYKKDKTENSEHIKTMGDHYETGN